MLKLFIFILLTIPITTVAQPYILVLGTAQDGGYPHIGCKRSCCNLAWGNNKKINVVSLALVDPENKKWWLFEATPDIKEQLQLFKTLTRGTYNYLPEGIFITHAHIGHYTGLMQLGREAMGAKNVTVYVMPQMSYFLKNNAPWKQLVSLNNIKIHTVSPNSVTGLSKNTKVYSFQVPHRDEFSETVGYSITTSGKKYLFIPDINKWDKWERDIIQEVKKVDVAFLDATFYKKNELPNLRMSEVPHPYVEETIKLFSNTSESIRSKIHFIHFNHTNPLLWNEDAATELNSKGYHIAVQGEKL